MYVSCYQTGASLNYASYRCVTSDGYAAYTWAMTSTYGGYSFTTTQSEIDISCSRDQYLQVRVTATASGVTYSGASEYFRCNAGGDIEPI